MKTQRRHLRSLFAVSLLFFAFTINALPEESVSQKPQISQENKSQKLSEKTLKQVYTYINQIACIFGDLATLVQEDAIKTKDKEAKTALNQAIISTRKAISVIAKELDNSPAPEQLQTTLSLLKQLIAHLEGYLKADFTQYKAFDLDAHRKRLIVIDPTTLTEESLLSNLTEAESKLKVIQKKADDTGLYLYNHLYRNTIDKFIVRPCDKYNLHWKGLYTIAAISGAAYVWYKFSDSTAGCEPIEPSVLDAAIPDMSYWEKFKAIPGNMYDTLNHYSSWNNVHAKINGTIRNWMGWSPRAEVTTREALYENVIAKAAKEAPDLMAPHIAKLEKSMDLHNDIKLFGRIEKAALDIVRGHWYLGTALLWEPFRTSIGESYTKYSGKLKNWALGWHNWLKGGAYYQRHKNKKGSFGRIDPRYVFDDIIGLEHAKEILGNIVKYMQDPESYDRAGLAPAKGYLLYGPTRTGKTMLAEALAGEVQKVLGYSSEKFPFFVIEARWIAAEGNFDFMMKIIKEHAPCIIFIDEIDMLNLHRDKFKDKNVLLSEFLSTLSGCMNADPDKQVIILAATNSPQNLDPSLQSRFAVHIPFEYPSFINRAEYFINTLEGKGLPIEQFDIKKLAEQTEGCSFETLHKVINNAQFITREQGRPITQADIEKSLNTELHGIIYHNYIELPEDDQQILAVHMAGHAIAYTVTEGTGVRMSQVTIRPVSTKADKDSVLAECLKDVVLPNVIYGHVFTHHKADSLKFISQKEIERLCMIELAGHIAEKLIFGSHHNAKNTCSHHDTTKAFYWARKYQLNGLDEQLIAKSAAIQDQITKDAYAFMHECENKMRALLEPRIELIKLVAEGLKGFGTVGGDDMQTLIDLHKMLDGKTIEEFVKEMEEAAAKKTTEETVAIADTRAAVRDELGIDEITPETAAPAA